MLLKVNRFFESVRKTSRRLSNDNRGVAAIEFAFIAPLLITLYLGTLEVSGALQMNKKVSRAASSTGDLIAQLDANMVNKANVDAILRIGKAITQPYSLTQPKITVTGIKIDNLGSPKISWSRQVNDITFSKPYLAGAIVNVPAKVKIADTFLIKVEASIEYRTLTSWSIAKASGQTYGKIDMSEVFFLRPRVAPNDLPCLDC
ncbi:MAG: TadE/TadG family type IV pilus assembly protein [Rhizobiaceae bacterium]